MCLCLDLVIVAHSHNLIRFTASGNSVRSAALVSPKTEERLFGEVRGLERDKRKELLLLRRQEGQRYKVPDMRTNVMLDTDTRQVNVLVVQ